MRVERVDTGDLRKGKAVIVVARKGDKEYMTDGIVINTANVVAEDVTKISILDELEIGEEDKIIYICGHGNKKEKTIGGIGIREIARKVIEAGYIGEQLIVITSCEVIEEINNERREWRLGKRGEVKDSKCMLDMFKEEIEKEFPRLKGRGYVRAYGDGSTVTVRGNGDTEKIEVWVIKEDGWTDRVVNKHLGVYQKQVLRRLGKCSVEINVNRLNKDIEDREIEVYKRGLILGKLYWVEELATWSKVVGYSLGVLLYTLLMLKNVILIDINAEVVAYISVVNIVMSALMQVVTRRVRDYRKLKIFIVYGIDILKGIVSMMLVQSLLQVIFHIHGLELVVYSIVMELGMLGVRIIEADR
nr:hypothetical protein [uncultured Anaerosporobacter sp.]